MSYSLVEPPYLWTAPTSPLLSLSLQVAARVYPPSLIPGAVLSHPPSPPSRAGHVTTVTSDGLILTCGGQNYFSCLALDLSDSTWRNHSSLDSLRHYSSHAVLPSGLYILGGFYSSSSSFLPTGATTWEAGPSLPGMTFDSCAVAISETKFLLIGGWLETTRVSEYNSETGSWETWPSLVQARAGHACAR